MKQYEIKKGEFFDTLKIIEQDKTWTTPFNSGSARWLEYLRYTAWVEAGNTPEDFWTQDDELIEPSEPKKEEETTEGES